MEVTRRNLLRAGATAAVAASLPMPFVKAASAADEIILASLYDLSGPFEEVGKQMYDTLTFAVEEINASGGLVGKKISRRQLRSAEQSPGLGPICPAGGA